MKLESDTKTSNNNTTQDIPVDLLLDEQKQKYTYLDDFLRAVKVFGYLERPVFNELTKSMQMHKLRKDEVMLMNEKLGFSIVVGGKVQVFYKVKPIMRHTADNEDDVIIINNEKYHLLTEVSSGAPLSSHIDILSLFTDTSQTQSHSTTSSEGVNLPKILTDVIVKAQTDSTIAVIPSESFKYLARKYPKSINHVLQIILSKLNRVTFQTMHSYFSLTNEIFETEVKLNLGARYELPLYLYDGMIKKLLKMKEIKEEERKIDEPPIKRVNLSLKDNNVRHKGLRSNNESSIIPFSYFDPHHHHRDKSYHFSSYINKALQTSSKNFVHDDSESPRPPLLPHKPRPPILSHKSRQISVSIDPDQLSPHPGDLLTNVPLSRRETLYQLPDLLHTSNTNSRLGLNVDNEIKLRMFSADEETEDTSLRIALTEGIFKLLGIERDIIKTFDDDSGASKFSNSVTPFAASIISNGGRHPLKRMLSVDSLSTTSFDGSSITSSITKNLNDTFQFEDAQKEFAEELSILYIKENETLVTQGEENPGLFYLIKGLLEVGYYSNDSYFNNNINDNAAQNNINDDNNYHVLYTIKPGEIAGYLGTIMSTSKSLITIRVVTDSYLGFIPQKSFNYFLEKKYKVYLAVIAKFLTVLSNAIVYMDFALEWVQTEGGKKCLRQGSDANDICLVLNGRFRSIVEEFEENENEKYSDLKSRKTSSHNHLKKYKVLQEFAQGDSIGEVEVLTASKFPFSLVAVRESEIVKIPRTLLNSIALQYPSINIMISRKLARKMKDQSVKNPNISNYNYMSKNPYTGNSKSQTTYNYNKTQLQPGSKNQSTATTTKSITSYNNLAYYKTITILPINPNSNIPLAEFGEKLLNSFKAIGQDAISLNRSTVFTPNLGGLCHHHAFNKLSKLKLSGYFADVEDTFDKIIYIIDPNNLNSSWNDICMSRADCILFVADALFLNNANVKDNSLNFNSYESFTEIGSYEENFIKMDSMARSDLVLLHPDRAVSPGLTKSWLKDRKWINSCHHIQMAIKPNIVVETTSLRNFMLWKEKLANLKLAKSLKSKVNNIRDDLLEKYKLGARKQEIYSNSQAYKSDFNRLARILSGKAVGLVLGGGGARGIAHLGILRALEDQGIPVDMIGGTSIGSFVGGLYAKEYNFVKTYGRVKKFSSRMARLWIWIFDFTYPFTSYTTGHEFNIGIWKAFGDSRIEDFWISYYANSTNITQSRMEVHSSGYAWRYIRASMSLAGLVPPIVDVDGSMLLDGGYIDNLTVSEMRSRGANIIVAVDVGSVDDKAPMRFGDSLSGLWIIFNRWNPFSRIPNVPTMTEIQMRLGYVSSVVALEAAKITPGILYIRPPIDDYATLDFGRFVEIYTVGLTHCLQTIKKWKMQDIFPEIPGSIQHSRDKKGLNPRVRRNSI